VPLKWACLLVLPLAGCASLGEWLEQPISQPSQDEVATEQDLMLTPAPGTNQEAVVTGAQGIVGLLTGNPAAAGLAGLLATAVTGGAIANNRKKKQPAPTS
jgi:hypothetical protein